MKTQEYFREKTRDLKVELRDAIKEAFKLKLQDGQSFCNNDITNAIDFENLGKICEEECIIDFIDYGAHNIVIYPERSDLEPIDLESIENIHNLMLIHHIALNDLVE